MRDFDMREGITVKGYNSFEGVVGKIVKVFRFGDGTLNSFTLRVEQGGKYNYPGDLLELTNPAQWEVVFVPASGPSLANQAKVEKPCRLPTCGRKNYTDAKACWWCSTPNPTR